MILALNLLTLIIVGVAVVLSIRNYRRIRHACNELHRALDDLNRTLDESELRWANELDEVERRLH